MNSSEVSCGSESVKYRSKNFLEACVVHDPLYLLCMIQNVNLSMWPLECGNTGKSENFKDVRIVLEGQHNTYGSHGNDASRESLFQRINPLEKE